MEIKTKYNIGERIHFKSRDACTEADILGRDRILFCMNDYIVSGKINTIHISRDNKIYYEVDGYYIYEKKIICHGDRWKFINEGD